MKTLRILAVLTTVFFITDVQAQRGSLTGIDESKGKTYLDSIIGYVYPTDNSTAGKTYLDTIIGYFTYHTTQFEPDGGTINESFNGPNGRTILSFEARSNQVTKVEIKESSGGTYDMMTTDRKLFSSPRTNLIVVHEQAETSRARSSIKIIQRRD